MRWLALLLIASMPANAVALDVIAYHDVRDHVASNYDADQYAVSTENLMAHLRWLRDAGFQPVSVSQILAAESGGAPLPDKAVLLTFDDGLHSFYTKVYPLLKLFRFPAVVSVVTSWIEMDGNVEYSADARSRDDFLTWAQIREMQASGLVEVGSHSHNLHRGITGNPQGNLQPATVTRFFDGSTYEDEMSHRARIAEDLATSVATIVRHTGQVPRVITWPFGAFNDAASEIAANLGMQLSLTLEPDDDEHHGLLHRGRLLIAANPTLSDLSAELTTPGRAPVLRVAQVDLDYVYDPDPVQQEANLGRLLDRIKTLQISHVYLQAYADPDGDGATDALYFPNRHLPVRADLFSRVAWQLKTRANVRVYAWMPMLSFSGGPFGSDMKIIAAGDAVPDPTDHRLSPFHADAVMLIGDIYEDLAVHARFDGLLFHDDGRLDEREDFSAAAVAAYREQLGVVPSPERQQGDPELTRQFTALKTQALIDLSKTLSERVRPHLPALRTARNIFASALLDGGAPDYLAQDYDVFLDAYDHVALLAMPGLEGAEDDQRFFRKLVAAASSRATGLARTIFELQTVSWPEGSKIEGNELRQTMRWLQSLGVRHLGYYPDDFITGHPPIGDLHAGMSLADEYRENSQ